MGNTQDKGRSKSTASKKPKKAERAGGGSKSYVEAVFDVENSHASATSAASAPGSSVAAAMGASAPLAAYLTVPGTGGGIGSMSPASVGSPVIGVSPGFGSSSTIPRITDTGSVFPVSPKSKVYHVLVAGIEESGKSTFLRQVGFRNRYIEDKDDPKLKMVEMLYKLRSHIIESVARLGSWAIDNRKLLENRMDRVQMDLVDELRDFVSGQTTSVKLFYSSKSKQMYELWRSDCIQEVWRKHRFRVQLASYSIDSVLDRMIDIEKDDYRLSEEDFLKMRVKTHYVNKVTMEIDGKKVEFREVGGQRYYRTRLPLLEDDSAACLFFVALGDYDSTVNEKDDTTTNRIQEALNYWASLQRYSFPLYIVFTKSDLFRDKLTVSPLSDTFSGFSGPDSYRDSLDFIKGEFEKVCEALKKELKINSPYTGKCFVVSNFDGSTVDEIIKYVVKDISSDRNISEASLQPLEADSSISKTSIASEFKEVVREERRHFNILLAGIRDSGKSTFKRQMELSHDVVDASKDPKANLNVFLKVIRKNIAEGLVDLGDFAIENASKIANELSVSELETISELKSFVKGRSAPPEDFLSEDLAEKSYDLWLSPAIQEVWMRFRSFVQVPFSFDFFFDKIPRIAKSDYQVSKEDFLRMRIETTSVDRSCIQLDDKKVELREAAGDKKLRNRFRILVLDSHACLFFVALGDYDEVFWEYSEDSKQVNRIQECMNYWAEVQKFTIPFYLIFTKKDIFVEKISKTPLSSMFAGFSGPDTYEKSFEFLKGQFEAICEKYTKDYGKATPYTGLHFVVDVFDSETTDEVLKAVMADLSKRSKPKTSVSSQTEIRKPPSSAASSVKDEVESKHIEEEKEMRPLIFVLAGIEESGKSTFVRQLEFSEKVFDETAESKYQKDESLFRLRVNIIDFLSKLCDFALAHNSYLENKLRARDKDNIDKILPLSKKGTYLKDFFTEDLCQRCYDTFKSKAIQEVWKKYRSRLPVPYSFETIFYKALEIGRSDYRMTDEDLLRLRWKTHWSVQTPIKIGHYQLILNEIGGQRFYRQRFSSVVPATDAALYFVALGDYDQTVFETDDSSTNRVQESLNYWADVLRLSTVPIYLIFTKVDVFKEKIAAEPLSKAFSGFEGPDTFEKSLAFIVDQFLKVCDVYKEALGKSSMYSGKYFVVSSFDLGKAEDVMKIIIEDARRFPKSK